MKVRDVIKRIETDGWIHVRTRGSHRQFNHSTKLGVVTVPGKLSDELAPGDAEQYPQASGPEVKYLIILEPTATGFSAYSPDLLGCASTGATRAECETNMHEAIEFHLDGLRLEGPAAAIAAITKMRKIDTPALVARAGTLAQEGWRELAAKHGLRAKVEGRPGLCHFALDYGDDSQALLTLLTQSMLDRGFFTSGVFYPSCTHTDEVVREYLAALDEVMAVLKTAVEKGNVMSLLRGPVAHKGFRRLN